MANGNLGGALRYLLDRADHTGWILVGVIPAIPVSVLSHLTGREPQQFAYLVAMFLSLGSVACIALTFAIAQRLGASPREALTGATLLSLAASFFYWSRHLVPYDVAMALALSGLWVGLRRGGASRSFASGLLAGSAFAVYNGYWTLAVLAVGLQCVLGARNSRRLIIRAAAGLAGLAVPTLLVMMIGRLLAHHDEIAQMRDFASSVKQGDWGDGFTFPFQYLWSADKLLAVAWLVAAVLTITRQFGWHAPLHGVRGQLRAIYRRGIGADPATRAFLLLLCVSIVYASLAGGSAILRVFVVYGRLVRQLVPFLCLLTAAAAASRVGNPPRWLRSSALLALAAAVQLYVAFGPPFAQTFPLDLEAKLFEYRPLGYAATVTGPELPAGNSDARFVLVNALYLYPPRGVQPPPKGSVVFSVAHPLQYAPYCLEGFRGYERAILAESDISIRLIDRGAGEASR